MLDFLNPYMWLIKIGSAAIVVVLLAIGFNRAANHYEQVGYNRATLEHVAIERASEKAADLREQSMMQKLRKAEQDAAELETTLNARYVASHRAYTGLRVTVADLQSRIATNSAEANRATASAALTVFGECADEYRALAEVSDRHTVDVKRLSDGWPE